MSCEYVIKQGEIKKSYRVFPASLLNPFGFVMALFIMPRVMLTIITSERFAKKGIGQANWISRQIWPIISSLEDPNPMRRVEAIKSTNDAVLKKLMNIFTFDSSISASLSMCVASGVRQVVNASHHWRTNLARKIADQEQYAFDVVREIPEAAELLQHNSAPKNTRWGTGAGWSKLST